MAKIFLVEDSENLREAVTSYLRLDEHEVTEFGKTRGVLEAIASEKPDLIILDVMLPDGDGFLLARQIRKEHQIPILFLTAKIKDEDKIAGFNAGADDYLCKPFNIDELILRLRAILRRAKKYEPVGSLEAEGVGAPSLDAGAYSAKGGYETRRGSNNKRRIMVGSFVLDTRSYELITPARGKVRLTPVQYELLHHLMCHPGEIFSPSRLLDEVWDYPSDTGSPDLVRVHIKNLRERVEDNPRDPSFIRTVPGYGYTVGQEIE